MPLIEEQQPSPVAQPMWPKRTLDGLTILIVEDEPLIQLDLQQTLETAGARVLLANDAKTARRQVESPDLSGAVVDWIDPDICQRLTERGLPFLLYSGRAASALEGWLHVPVVQKPAMPNDIISTLERLLSAPYVASDH